MGCQVGCLCGCGQSGCACQRLSGSTATQSRPTVACKMCGKQAPAYSARDLSARPLIVLHCPRCDVQHPK